MEGLGLVKKNTPSKQKEIEFDGKMAHILYNCLKSNKLLMRGYKPPSIKSWAREFAILRQYTTKKEIELSVNWLSKNILGEFTPRVYSAKSFRAKFDQILEHAKKDNTTQFSEVVISEAAKKICDREELRWPGLEKEFELPFIQLNINYFEGLFNRINQLHSKLELEAKQKDLKHFKTKGLLSSAHWRSFRLVGVVKELMGTPTTLTTWWLLKVNNASWKWANWNGRLMNWVLNDKNEKLQMHLSRFIADFSGDGGEFYSIVWPLICETVVDN